MNYTDSLTSKSFCLKGWERYMVITLIKKKSGVVTLILDRVDFWARIIPQGTRASFYNEKGVSLSRRGNNSKCFNNIASKYLMQQHRTVRKIDKFTIKRETLQYPLSTSERTSR